MDDTMKKCASYFLDLKMGCMEFMAREQHNIVDEDIEFYNRNREKIDEIVRNNYSEIFK